MSTSVIMIRVWYQGAVSRVSAAVIMKHVG